MVLYNHSEGDKNSQASGVNKVTLRTQDAVSRPRERSKSVKSIRCGVQPQARPATRYRNSRPKMPRMAQWAQERHRRGWTEQSQWEENESSPLSFWAAGRNTLVH